jgi:dUTP pyrophosphatase
MAAVLRVVKLVPEAVVPSRGTAGAVGYDLACVGPVHLPPCPGRVVVGTGIAMAVPPGYYAQVEARSGLATRHGIQVGAGVIDQDYRGEVKVVLFGGPEAVDLPAGTRIAQFVVLACGLPDVQEVPSVEDLGATARGARGFGSTGMAAH